MITEKITIGIDVSKDSLDTFNSQTKEHLKFENSLKGMKKLKTYFKKAKPTLVAVESTNIYHRRVARLCSELFIDCVVVQPSRVRKYAEALGYLAKTDKIDAQVITQFGEQPSIKPTKIASTEEEKLRDSVVHGMQLSKYRSRIQTLRTEAAHHEMKKSFDVLLKTLDQQIKAFEEMIIKAIGTFPELKERYELLLSIKGVGKVGASVLVILMPELGALSKTKATALAGLAPYNADSGTHKGKRCIYGGRSRIRQALYMCVLAATKHDAFIKAVYQRLLSNGKPKKLAQTACMRKMLIIANEILRTKKPYNCDIPLGSMKRAFGIK